MNLGNFSLTPSQQSFNPSKNFNQRIDSFVNPAKNMFGDSKEQLTPKPQYYSQNRSVANDKAPYEKPGLNLVSPAFAIGFAKDQNIINKKRQYVEISQPPRQKDFYRSEGGTPFYTFDDNSTIKPNQFTIIRNPTLMSLGIGQPDQQNKNHKTSNIQPMNLSQKQFYARESLENDQDDNDFYTPNDYHPGIKAINVKKNRQPFRMRDLTKEDVTKMCNMAFQVVEQIQDINGNLLLNDIDLVNSKGRSYEYVPFQFLMTNSAKIPQLILRDMNDAKQSPNSYFDVGFLDSLQTAYFCINKRLYLWPYSFGVGQDGIVSRQNIIGNPEKIEFDQTITACAVCNPMTGINVTDPDDKLLVIATATQINIKILRKGVRDSKLQVEETDYRIPTDSNIITKIVQFKRNGRIFYGGFNGHVNELFLQKSRIDNLISFFAGDKKKLKQHDLEKGNIFARLIPQFLKLENKRRIIDIKIDEQRNVLYSFGSSLDNRSLDQTIIEVFDLGLLGTSFKRVISINQYEVVERLYEIQGKSLRGFDIFQVSQAYKIVFISPILFSESKSFHLYLVTQNGYRMYLQFALKPVQAPDERDIFQEGAVADFINTERFTGKWEIVQVLDFPAEDLVEEQLEQAMQQGIYKVYNMQCSASNINIDMQTVAYDNTDSLLVFSDSSQVQEYDQDELFNRSIRLNFIKKNESTYAHLKQLQTGQPFNMFEQYSYLQVNLDMPRVAPYNQQFNPADDMIPLSESILEIKIINTYQFRETQKLLGLSKSHLDYKGPDHSSNYSYLSINELEKQALMLQKRIHVMTDQRVFEVQQVRPIDSLAMILHTLTRPGNSSYDDFEDFMDLFSIREVCGMLVQLICDNNGLYLFSKRIENQINQIKSKNRRVSASQPRQQYRGGGGTVGSKSSLYHSPYAPKQSNYSSMIDGQRTTLDLIRFSGQESHNEYVIKNCNIEIVTFRILMQLQKNLALKLLQLYGDSISKDSVFKIEDEQLEGCPLSASQFSSNILAFNSIDKHYALYLYVSRLIRPIWLLKIVYPANIQKQDKFIPSFESLTQLQLKLQGVYDLVQSKQECFFGEQGKSDLKIRNNILLDQVVLVSQISYDERERLEIMERNSLNNLMILVLRSIEVINLLSILNFNNDVQLFIKLWSKLSKQQQYELTMLQFSDLVSNQNNSLIRKILEASIDVQHPANSEKAAQLINERAGKIERLCESLFTKGENKIFIGESYLQQAIKERNIEQKEVLLKRAIDELSKEALKIDLTVITPLLVENGNFSSLVDLTLRKIKALKQMSQTQIMQMSEEEHVNQLDQCYSVIFCLFSALDTSINKTESEFNFQQNKAKDNDLLELYLRKLKQITNNEPKIQLMNKIMNRIEQFNDQLLIDTIFKYLISKPQSRFNFELLPKISKESFDKICDSTINSRRIQRNQFDSIIKLLSRQPNLAERLCTLVLNVISDKQLLYDTVEFISKDDMVDASDLPFIEKQDILSMEDRIIYLQKAEVVLNEQKQIINPDIYSRLTNNISSCHTQIFNQIMVIKNIQEMIEGNDNIIIKKREQMKDQTANIEQKKKLQLALSEINYKLLTKQELLKDFIDELGLHESKIQLILQDDEQSYRNNEVVLKHLEEMIKDIMLMFPKKFQIKLIEKIQPFIHQKRTDIYKGFLKLIELQNEQYFKDKKQLMANLESLLNGNRLHETRFWLLEHCILNWELSGLQVSDFIMIFTSQIKKLSFSSQQTQQSQYLEIQNEFMAARYICLFKLWTYQNMKLFPDQYSTIQLGNRSMDLKQDRSNKELFVQDLHQNAANLYQQLYKDRLLEYFDRNKIVIEKNISTIMERLINEVEKEFLAMLKQHQVKLKPSINLSNSFPQENAVALKSVSNSVSFVSSSQDDDKSHNQRSLIISQANKILPNRNDQLFENAIQSPFNANDQSIIRGRLSINDSPSFIQVQNDQFSLGNGGQRVKRSKTVQRDEPNPLE